MIFPPRDSLQLGAANRALASAGVGWRFARAVSEPDTVAATGLEGIGGARVARRLGLVAAGSPARGAVLARVGGEPWIVRSGRTVVAGSRFVLEETDLPLRAGFVPALAVLLAHAARGDEGALAAAPGEPVLLPDGVGAVGTVPPTVPVSSEVRAPLAPGAYPLLAGTDTVGSLVVAADPRESVLARASDAQVAAAFPGARVRVVDAPRAYAAARFAGAGRSDLTPWLLAAALVVLVAESLVAAGLRRGVG